MSTFKRQDTTSIGEGVEKREPLMVEVKTDVATTENYGSNMVGPKL